MNEYFTLIEDSDLDTESYGAIGWVWYCPECKALFGSKAIHGRTIFQWFGYHPNDGNCKVITEETAKVIARRATACDCPARIERVRSVKLLKELIEYNKKEGAKDEQVVR